MDKKNNFLEEDIGKRIKKIRSEKKDDDDGIDKKAIISIVVSSILVLGIIISVASSLF